MTDIAYSVKLHGSSNWGVFGVVLFCFCTTILAVGRLRAVFKRNCILEDFQWICQSSNCLLYVTKMLFVLIKRSLNYIKKLRKTNQGKSLNPMRAWPLSAFCGSQQPPACMCTARDAHPLSGWHITGRRPPGHWGRGGLESLTYRTPNSAALRVHFSSLTSCSRHCLFSKTETGPGFGHPYPSRELRRVRASVCSAVNTGISLGESLALI